MLPGNGPASVRNCQRALWHHEGPRRNIEQNSAMLSVGFLTDLRNEDLAGASCDLV